MRAVGSQRFAKRPALSVLYSVTRFPARSSLIFILEADA